MKHQYSPKPKPTCCDNPKLSKKPQKVRELSKGKNEVITYTSKWVCKCGHEHY